jgi:hypothetical protein
VTNYFAIQLRRMVGGIFFAKRRNRMPRMCAFPGGSVGPLFVDATQVRMTKAISPTETLLESVKGRTWTVDLPLDQVRRVLDTGLNSDEAD